MEGQWVECGATRTFTPETFGSGGLTFPVDVQPGAGWIPSKSFVRIGLTLNGSGGVAPTLSQMVALADNAAGNLFSSASVRVGQREISSMESGMAQASALEARVERGRALLESIAAGTNVNIAKFSKRNLLTASGSTADAYLDAKNEMYKPVAPTHWDDAKISISAAVTTTLTALTGVNQAAATALSFVRGPLSGVATDPVVLGVVANPYSAITLANAVTVVGAVTGVSAANNALATFTEGGVVTGTNTLFASRMPNSHTGAATGGSVAIGDILVVAGVYYPITAIGSDTALTVANPPSVAIVDSVNWYIIRKDPRAPVAKNTIYVNWRPPLGIFRYNQHLAPGDYKIVLGPNADYRTACIETKNPDFLAGTTYSLSINDVRVFAYLEQIPMPPDVRELPLLEYQVQSMPWNKQLNFTVPSHTESLTFFVQDIGAGQNAMIPPSMFKCLDNSDLKLKSIVVSYAGFTKPSTSVESYFFSGVDQFQQRYLSSYEESGQDLALVGCESYEEYLSRGPFYHFSFDRALDSRSNAVVINTQFDGLPNGPTSSLDGAGGSARVFCIARYKTVARLTQQGGSTVRSELFGV